MPKRSRVGEDEEDEEESLPVIPLVPRVVHNSMFWKNLQKSHVEYDRRQLRCNHEVPMRYCKFCSDVKNSMPMSFDTFHHLASHPNHLEMMRMYDKTMETNYFVSTLFQMNEMIGCFVFIRG